MAPPPKKGEILRGAKSLQQLLPNQFSVGGGGLSSTSTSGGRPTSTSTSTSTGRGGGNNVNANVLTEEQRLKTAYSLYLQQGFANMLTHKLSRMSATVTREEVGAPGVQREVDNLFKIKRELLYRDTWVAMLESCLESGSLHDIFVELREQFMGGKERTLDGLKTALESQFNRILIEGEGADAPTTFDASARIASLATSTPKEVKLQADAELEDVIQRAKAYVGKLDTSMDPGAGRRLTEDNPQFLASFIAAMTEITREHGEISSCKQETAEQVGELVTATSAMISASCLEQERNKGGEGEGWEERRFGGEDFNGNENGYFSPGPCQSSSGRGDEDI